MTHEPETTIEDELERWFVERYGADAVETQVYQSEPRWYCDIVVDAGYGTLYVEVENDADSVRDGVAQALGYAADSPTGVPVVVTPKGHVDPPRLERLRSSSTVLVRQFDEEAREFA